MDIEGVYRSIWHAEAIELLALMGVPIYILGYFHSWLRGRSFRARLNTRAGRKFSKSYMRQAGVPQGSIGAPWYWNVVTNKFAPAWYRKIRQLGLTSVVYFYICLRAI